MKRRFTADDYRGAAEYLRTHGWVQEMGQNGAPRCALGALYSTVMARGESEYVYWNEVTCGREFQRESDQRFGAPLSIWNDREGRTAEEVISALESWAFDEDLKAAATAHTLDAPTPEAGGLVSRPQLVEAR